ncbi:hypothetical protein AZOA_30380 [Azoarcus sp. Aa7]|nr:hypothetical protein [Azoarcus sp. Aa7]
MEGAGYLVGLALETQTLESVMLARADDAPRREPLPHRWHVLQMLRSMHAGYPFIHLWDLSCLTHLEGAPMAVHYFGFLERNGYIVPCAKEGPRAHYYTLSSDGVALYEAGERWWRTLRWPQKYFVIWHG